MTTPALVVAGDNDNSQLTNVRPEWFSDAYTLSPGADWLATLFGAEHMLGGISGYLVTETTEKSPASRRGKAAYVGLPAQRALSWRQGLGRSTCRVDRKFQLGGPS